MAEHYDTAVLPARQRKAKGKAKVEVAVQVSQRQILARIRNETFFSLNELDGTPEQAVAEVVPRPLDLDVARVLFRVRESRTVHKKDGCVSVLGRRFPLRGLPPPGPHRLPPGRQRLPRAYAGARGGEAERRLPRPGPTGLRPPPPRARPPLAYADLATDEAFDEARFVDVLQDLGGLSLRAASRREAGAFWKSFGPLPEDLVRIGVEHAVRLHGRGRHVRVYLHAVRVLAHWRSNPTKEKP